MKTISVVICALTALALTGCSSSDEPAPAPAPTSAPAPEPATQARPAPFGPSDPRCAPASANAVGLVQAGLTRAGWLLTNGTVIDAGGKTYLGATIVDQDGKVKERSDVWVVSDGTVYASSSGARNNTTFAKASGAPLNISAGDELVQAVDVCVVNATLGR